jgi:hypothetical protein
VSLENRLTLTFAKQALSILSEISAG